jgi:hypothetical protein
MTIGNDVRTHEVKLWEKGVAFSRLEIMKPGPKTRRRGTKIQSPGDLEADDIGAYERDQNLMHYVITYSGSRRGMVYRLYSKQQSPRVKGGGRKIIDNSAIPHAERVKESDV